jgi:hypothetical protein
MKLLLLCSVFSGNEKQGLGYITYLYQGEGPFLLTFTLYVYLLITCSCTGKIECLFFE